MKFSTINLLLVSVFGLFICIIGYDLFTHGMFMDGVLYADVSMNLAQGNSDFWNLKCTETLLNPFHEHPPLAFGMQAIFFKIFGNHYLTENIYNLFCYVSTVFIIFKIWKHTQPINQTLHYWVLALILVLIPQLNWGIPNNILENTLMIFTSLSVYWFVLSTQKKWIFYVFIAGFALFLGFLTKGFVALFPLCFPFFYWLFFNKETFYSMTIKTMIACLGLIIPMVILFTISNSAYDSIYNYYTVQVKNSLVSIQTVDSRFYIVWKLIETLAPLLIILFIIVCIKWKQKKLQLFQNKWIIMFLALGLSGVLPIMISLKQNSFYMTPALPIIALSLAHFLIPIIKPQIDYFENTYKKTIATIGVVFSAVPILLFLMVYNTDGRDHDLLHDIRKIEQRIGSNQIIGAHQSLAQDWSSHGHFFRMAHISLEIKNKIDNKYCLVLKEDTISLPIDYSEISIDLLKFRLLEKNTIQP